MCYENPIYKVMLNCLCSDFSIIFTESILEEIWNSLKYEYEILICFLNRFTAVRF